MGIFKAIVSCLIFLFFSILFLKFGGHILNVVLIISFFILGIEAIYLKFRNN